MKHTYHRFYPIELAIIIALFVTLVWGAVSLHSGHTVADQVVRFHVLANSDSSEDQTLKRQVRDVILPAAQEIASQAQSPAEAVSGLRNALPELEGLAAEEIARQGYDYPVSAELNESMFPTKSWDGMTLPAGEYQALRVVIGEGGGHNWWCVLFPTLTVDGTTELSTPAMAEALPEDTVRLVTEPEGATQFRFKSIELWQQLREKLR